MKICLKTIAIGIAFAFAVLLVAGAENVFAVDDLGLFELEGDAVDDSGAPLPDDWATLYNNGANTGGGSFVFTGIEPDPAPESIFDGGKKDIQDPTEWSGKDGSVPDKNDITNAYAAGYFCPAGETDCAEGDLIVYFGDDRVSNNGDAFMGFWFFGDDVSFDETTGNFTCSDADGDGLCHTEVDTLVLVNFPQATNAVPEIRVVRWDITCSKADNNDPQPGDCAAKNLRLIADGAVCGTTPNDDACAITNDETEEAPWPFVSKNADPAFPTDFPFESFFEGGINLTRVIGGDACFASFMAESRSSSSFTASLKDFVIDSFPVCAVELSKDCGTGTYNTATGNLEIPYSVTVNNTGGATVSQVVATDNDCGFGSGTTLTFGPLNPNQSATLTGTCYIPAGTDLSEGVSNGVSAVADGGDVTVVLADSCVTDSSAPGKCFDECAFNLSPVIDVTKQCTTVLVAEDGVVKVKVNFSGTVSNTSDQPQCVIPEDQLSGTCVFPDGQACTANGDCTAAPVPLKNLAATNNPSGDLAEVSLQLLDADMNPIPANFVLNPGLSVNYSSTYLPDGTGTGWAECPSEASFADTVIASGEDVFTSGSVSDMATASCDLCAGDDPTCPSN